MKAQRSKKKQFPNLNSPQAVEEFRIAALAFTAKATASKRTAVKTLHKAGITTASGKLSKHYS
jgi:hypothetical protein